MTLDEISASLPNGFHDAKLAGYSVNFTDRTVQMDLTIWTGNRNAMETYRRASLELEGLYYWIIEPPDLRYNYAVAEELTIDIGPVFDLEMVPTIQPPPVPTGTFANWLFVGEWNAFIYLAAQSAKLTWQESE
jgi:hypothetical protein